MSMPVMDVWPVPMDMRYWAMGMSMVVRFRHIEPSVSMRMVLIVNVYVSMCKGLMCVQVPVFFPVKKEDTGHHENCG